MTALKIGDRVGYAAAFLRSTGQFTGPVPFRRGEILGFEELAPGCTLAGVQWDNEARPSSVNIKNLARVGSIAWAGV